MHIYFVIWPIKNSYGQCQHHNDEEKVLNNVKGVK